MKTRAIPTPANWQNLKYHPLACLVPFGAGIDMELATEHMRTHGFSDNESITLLRVQDVLFILDGRHLQKMAVDSGKVPLFRELVDGDPAAFVAKKIHRQHLDASQRAMIAASIATATQGGNQVANLPLGKTADMMNVSKRSAVNAAKVQDRGTKSLNAAVQDGTVSVSDAAAIASESAQVQNQAVKDVASGVAPTARAAVEMAKAYCLDCQRKIRLKMELPDKCAECKELNKMKLPDKKSAGKLKPEPDREPGDDTEAIEEENRQRRTASQASAKNGQVVFDWKSFDTEYGALLRQVDKLGNAYRAKDSDPAKALRVALAQWKKEFRVWEEKLSKK